MVIASQLRPGMAIRQEGQVFKVLECTYHAGQGKMGGVTHARLKNLSTGKLWDHSFRADLKLEELPVERLSLQYLYSDAELCYFMNPENFEQVSIESSVIGPQTRFLQPEMVLPVEYIDGSPVSVQFPDTLEVRIEETAPPIRGQQDSTWKSATLENGIEVQVPLFIKTGDTIRLDLQSLKYVDRVHSN